MPKARNDAYPQHHMGLTHYGAMDIEHFPDGTAPGQIPYWDGVQWHLATLQGEGQIDLSFDGDSATLTLIAAEDRVYGAADADAILFRTYEGTFSADAELVV